MRKFTQNIKVVVGAVVGAVSSVVCNLVNLKNYKHVAVKVVLTTTDATTGALTFKQAKDNAGTGEKALGFTSAVVQTDAENDDTNAIVDVANDSITMGGSAGTFVYIVEFDSNELDTNADFTHVRPAIEDIAGADVSVTYLLSSKRYGGEADTLKTALD